MVAETGEARDVHQFACLIGYGANAINPYLALATIRAHVRRAAQYAARSTWMPHTRKKIIIAASNKGILKIMSKMGIATLDAYHGAQLFECIGLNETVIAPYFTRNVLARRRHRSARNCRNRFASSRTRVRRAATGATPRSTTMAISNSKRAANITRLIPNMVDALHEAVRTPGALNGNYREAYEKYLHFAALVNERPATDLADFLQFVPREPIPVERGRTGRRRWSSVFPWRQCRTARSRSKRIKP